MVNEKMEMWLPAEMKRWRAGSKTQKRDLISWWLASPNLSPEMRTGFARLQARLTSDKNFKEQFDSSLSEFERLQLNPHVLYFLCADFLHAAIPAHPEILEQLRKLRDIGKRKTGLLSETAAMIENDLLPVFDILEQRRALKLEPWVKHLPACLKETELAMRDILKRSQHMIKRRGAPPKAAPHYLIACLPEYFKARTKFPRWNLVADIGLLLTNKSADKDDMRQLDRGHKKIVSRSVLPNPLIQLDSSLR